MYEAGSLHIVQHDNKLQSSEFGFQEWISERKKLHWNSTLHKFYPAIPTGFHHREGFFLGHNNLLVINPRARGKSRLRSNQKKFTKQSNHIRAGLESHILIDQADSLDIVQHIRKGQSSELGFQQYIPERKESLT